jgi:hypothetical protein
MNFTATVPPPNWQVPRKRVLDFPAATRMPERENGFKWRGMLLKKEKDYSRAVSSAV